MPGRKKPEKTEAEKEHDYVMFNKIEGGEKRQGTLGEELDDKGAVGEVRRRRMDYRDEYVEKHGRPPRGGE
jgi:hypothetical protein